MTLHPQLSQVLELYDPQRLNAILLWLNAEFKDMLINPAQDITAINQESAASTAVDLDDLVRFSILNEFGLSFGQKPAFPWLKQEVCQKLAHAVD
jgi:hypothetical protein